MHTALQTFIAIMRIFKSDSLAPHYLCSLALIGFPYHASARNPEWMLVAPLAPPAFTGFNATTKRSDFCYPFRSSPVFTLNFLTVTVWCVAAQSRTYISFTENSRSPRYALLPLYTRHALRPRRNLNRSRLTIDPLLPASYSRESASAKYLNGAQSLHAEAKRLAHSTAYA